MQEFIGYYGPWDTGDDFSEVGSLCRCSDAPDPTSNLGRDGAVAKYNQITPLST